MKKLSILLLSIVLCLCLFACKQDPHPEGHYVAYLAEIPFQGLVFNGEQVTFQSADIDILSGSGKLKNVSKGTYEMDGNTVRISYENGNSDTFTYNAQNDTLSWLDGALIFYKYTK